MVVMHGAYQLPTCKVAELMGVHLLTVRCALRNSYSTGSVTKGPLQNGGQQMLNDIDCAVCGLYFHCLPFN